MEFLEISQLIGQVFDGGLFASDYIRNAAMFALAMILHNRKMNQLIAVIRQDLTAQQNLIGKLGGRVSKIEERLQLQGEPNGIA